MKQPYLQDRHGMSGLAIEGGGMGGNTLNSALDLGNSPEGGIAGIYMARHARLIEHADAVLPTDD